MNGAPGSETITERQFQAACCAAPYLHPKLQAIAYQPLPDVDWEKRRSLLKALPYEKRREIAAILEAAQQERGPPVIDGDGVEGRQTG
jgi:hypothetical protein